MNRRTLLLLAVLVPFVMPLHAEAARLWSSGCELQGDVGGHMTDALEFDNVAEGPNSDSLISTSIKHSGLSSCEVVATTTANEGPSLNHQYSSGTVATDVYFRTYLRVDDTPDAQVSLIDFWDAGTDGREGGVNLTTSGQLVYIDDDGTLLATSTTQFVPGQWYRIEINYDAADGAVVLIDGAPEINIGAHDGDAFDSVQMGVGMSFAQNNSGTFEIYFDDIAFNDTSGSNQAAWPGAGSIVLMQPNAAGDGNGCSSGDDTSVDEITPDDASTICVLDADSGGDVLDVNMESSTAAGLATANYITLVQVGVREAAASAASETWNARIKSAAGGTTSSGTATSHNDTTYLTSGDAIPRNYTLTSYVDPTTSVAWTPTGNNSLDNMQIGINASDGSPDINVSTLWALVEYIDEADRTVDTSAFSYCTTLTSNADGFVHGIATTTTGLFPLIATSSDATVRANTMATSSGGKVQVLDSLLQTPLDFVFVDEASCSFGASATAIPHFFEKYASSTGDWVAHLGTSNISSTSPKVVAAYYGNAAFTTNLNSPGQTYDTTSPLQPRGIWTLGLPGTATTTYPDFLDSTYNGNNGSSQKATSSVATAGYIDGSWRTWLIGSTQGITVPQASTINDLFQGATSTLSLWFYMDATNQQSSIIGKTAGGSSGTWNITANNAGGKQLRILYRTSGTAGFWTSAGNSVLPGVPYHLIFKYNITGLGLPEAYLNGVKQTLTPTTVPTGTPLSDAAFPMWIGNSDTANVELGGWVDQVGLYTYDFSYADLLTIFNNEKDSAQFWSFSAEQTPPAAGGASKPLLDTIFFN